MKGALTAIIALLLFTSFDFGQTRRKVGRPSSKSQSQAPASDPSRDSIVITGNRIRTKWIPVGTQGTHSMFVGAAYGQGDSSVGFSILSVDKNYHYETYNDMRILADGDPLLFLSGVLRQGGVSGVDATETLSTTIPVSEFTRMIEARRVDISIGINRLTFSPNNYSAFQRFLKAIEDMAKSEPKCNLNLSQSPELRGFRLGMTVEDVERRFGSATITIAEGEIPEILLRPFPHGDYSLRGQRVLSYSEPGQFYPRGRSTWHIINFDKSQFPEYEGVFRINLAISNNRISGIDIVYVNGGVWTSIDDFLAAITRVLKLPNTWKGSTLQCEDWSLRADMEYGNPILKLVDLTASSNAEKDQRERERQESEQKRKLFKP